MQIKNKLQESFCVSHGYVCRIIHQHMDGLGYISQWQAMVAGGLAGITAAFTTYPLEVVETRLIAQNCRELTYRGVLHTMSKIYRTEGLLALYRGFSLTVIGMFPSLVLVSFHVRGCITLT